MYRIGQLTQQITIEKKLKTPNGSGGFTSEFTVVDTVWAYARQLSTKSATEEVQAEKVTAKSLCIWVIRNRADIHESYYLRHKGELYNIRSIPPRNTHDVFMEITAERGVA